VRIRSEQGFSLIELLVAMAIGSIVIAAIVNMFIDQRKAYAIREQVTEMQQNARSGIDFLVHEITMAGYDPNGTAGAGIVAASANSIQFTLDISKNGVIEADENVTFLLYDDGADGDLDLGRQVDGVTELIAENIQALSLLYTLADGSTTDAPADPSQIRAVDVSLTARTKYFDPKFPDNQGYRNQTLSASIQIRNMGL
jgi:type IV pilus assembly protein PilW